MDRKEKIKNYKQNPFNTTNWAYDEATVSFLCPNDKKATFQYLSNLTGKDNFTRVFKVHECEDCLLRSHCTKAKEGNKRKIYYNEKWMWNQSSVFLKANLRVTCISVRGRKKVEIELGFAFMAVNLRKYTAKHANGTTNKGSDHLSVMIGTFFVIIS